MRILDWKSSISRRSAARAGAPAQARRGRQSRARWREIIAARARARAMRRCVALHARASMASHWMNFAVVAARSSRGAQRTLTAKQLAALERAIDECQRVSRAQLPQPLSARDRCPACAASASSGRSRVGLYVPAGSAPLPSAVIMLAVPARIAGCPQRVLCTPPRRDGSGASGGAGRRAAVRHRHGVQGRRRAGHRRARLRHRERPQGRQDLRSRQCLGDGRQAAGGARPGGRGLRHARGALGSAGDRR